jgi:hypothetical protein
MSYRIWAYTISKPLSASEQEAIVAQGKVFVNQWTAHENKLSADFSIENGRIILVKVNEDVYGASGCSIDKLTRFIKRLESDYNIELMNRFLVAYQHGDKVEVVHAQHIKTLLQNGDISENTMIYNTAIANDTEWHQWQQPLKDTWLKKYL